MFANKSCSKKNKINLNENFLTKDEYDSIEECKCGGPIFKFHDTTNNRFIIQCGYYKSIIEIDKKTKKKSWVIPKKVACNWRCIYFGKIPIFKEITNIKIEPVKTVLTKNKSEILEEKLRIFFSFLFVSNHSSTLDEINYLVINNLLREPRKTFWFPTTDHYMKVSHLETFQEYHDRIFSKKIIDLSHTVFIKKIDLPIKFYDFPFLRRNENKIIKIKKLTSSQFIDITDDELESSDSEDDEIELEIDIDDLIHETDNEIDIDRDQSDFESINDDNENIEVDEIDNNAIDDYDEKDIDYYDD